MRSFVVFAAWLLVMAGSVLEQQQVSAAYYGYGNPNLPPPAGSLVGSYSAPFTVCSREFTVSSNQPLTSVGVGQTEQHIHAALHITSLCITLLLPGLPLTHLLSLLSAAPCVCQRTILKAAASLATCPLFTCPYLQSLEAILPLTHL